MLKLTFNLVLNNYNSWHFYCRHSKAYVNNTTSKTFDITNLA